MRNYRPVWDTKLPISVEFGFTCCIWCRITLSVFLGFVSDCPSVCLLACHGCDITSLSRMRNYQPAQDAELPACPGCRITSLSRMQNYQPVQDAELSVWFSEWSASARLLNYQPVDNADFYLPVWYYELRVPACLGNESTCLLKMRQYLLSRMLTDLSF